MSQYDMNVRCFEWTLMSQVQFESSVRKWSQDLATFKPQERVDHLSRLIFEMETLQIERYNHFLSVVIKQYESEEVLTRLHNYLISNASNFNPERLVASINRIEDCQDFE